MLVRKIVLVAATALLLAACESTTVVPPLFVDRLPERPDVSIRVIKDTPEANMKNVVGNRALVVHFATNSAVLAPEDAAAVATLAKHVAGGLRANLTVEGHADPRGSNDYNQALSLRRAEAVRQALVTGGVGAGRVAVESYGESRPVCQEATAACWKEDRRAVVVTH